MSARLPALRSAMAAAIPGGVERVLAELSVADASDVFDRSCLPRRRAWGGAGKRRAPPLPSRFWRRLRSAAHRDRIALELFERLRDVFDIGVRAFEMPSTRAGLAVATAAVHSPSWRAFPDTHIFREHGESAAAAARRHASAIKRRLMSAAEPESLMDDILALDRRLKAEGHNPGTSADLTVATVFAARLSADLPSGSKNG